MPLSKVGFCGGEKTDLNERRVNLNENSNPLFVFPGSDFLNGGGRRCERSPDCESSSVPRAGSSFVPFNEVIVK